MCSSDLGPQQLALQSAAQATATLRSETFHLQAVRPAAQGPRAHAICSQPERCPNAQGAPLGGHQGVGVEGSLHPRCGTTFLFLVVMISIVVFTFIGKPSSLVQHLTRVACMPLIAGIAFECIRLSGKYFDRPFVKVIAWPGMQFQRLTTREPDLEMCAVAIASLEKPRS